MAKTKFFKWPGVLILMLTLALAMPLFTEAADGNSTIESFAVSGDPNATPAEQAPVFTSRTAVSAQSDDGQSAVTLPAVRVGESVPGGDVGDAVVDQPSEISPIWERLEALGPEDKANALIELEVGDNVAASDAAAIEYAESLWNRGVFAQAIAEIFLLEESGTGLAVGISWKTPKAVFSPDWADTDVRIGARTDIQETHLDFDAQNGNQFAVLKYPTGSWSVNISMDGGKTWQETYSWGSIADDVSAAVADDYLWVGYAANGTGYNEGRMRRFNVSDGSVDGIYGNQTVFDKDVPIKEIAVVTNADDFDNRMYYFAILDRSATVAATEAMKSTTAARVDSYPTAEQVPIEMGTTDEMLTQLADNPKLHFPDKILDDFREGETTTRVIVDLRDPEPIMANAVRPNFNDVAVRQAVTQQVNAVQNGVVDSMDPNEVNITNRFTYIFSFSAEVTVAGLAALMNHPDVIFIKEDGILEADLAQGIPLMNATTARSTYNGSGMSIAICDTGIDYTHPRLGNGAFPNSKVIGGYDTGQNDANPMDGNGHGTACAGIAAGDLGTVGDYIGGVAYNARLYALKISDTSTGGSAWESDMVEAWEWCITHQNDDPSNPIMIISQSFSGGYYTGVAACDAYWPSMTTAAANAKAAGITIFNSTGNDGYCDGTAWPGCLSDVIGVGAIYDADIGQNPDPGYVGCISSLSCTGFTTGCPCSSGNCYVDYTTAADQVTTYSNSASFMEVFAPSNDTYTLAIGGGYDSDFGGTSAACPYAAGSGAALQSAAMAMTGAYLTPDQVQSILEDTGDPVTDPKAPAITKPRVNLGNAVAAIATDNLLFFYASGVDTTTPVWNELGTGVSNAVSGLDATWNENYTSGSGYFLYASYIASDGVTNPVMVWRINESAMIEAIEVLSDFTGLFGRTSVSAYNDTIICAYEHSFTNGNGIHYNVSYDDGGSWAQGWWEPDSGHEFYNPDVTCRGGQGSAIVYDDEAGSFDPVWFRYRDHYSPGAWDAEVSQINDKDGATAWPNSIEWLPPRYGAIYISGDPDAGTPYFDRSDIVGEAGLIDFDGDATTDVAIYRPSSGAWFIKPSSGGGYYVVGLGGGPNDVPAPGDYDGDGYTDVAIYRPSSGAWFIKPSSGGSYYVVGLGGVANDVPVPGDYDGDGKTDCAIYRPSSGAWFIKPSSGGSYYVVGLGGVANDVPVPGDYDGDGKTDVAIYRPSSGAWFIKPSSGGSYYVVGLGGGPNDVPAPGDYDGDGKTDVAIYRPSSGAWFIKPSSGGSYYVVGLGGVANDVPVPGDYDGDGKTDCAIYRPSSGAWFIKPSSGSGYYVVGLGGVLNDIPVNPTAVIFLTYM